MWRGQVPPAPYAAQLSPPRPGDRIMLVDDSNEDWWKVTWQGGVRRDPGRHLIQPLLSVDTAPSSLRAPKTYPPTATGPSQA